MARARVRVRVRIRIRASDHLVEGDDEGCVFTPQHLDALDRLLSEPSHSHGARDNGVRGGCDVYGGEAFCPLAIKESEG